MTIEEVTNELDGDAIKGLDNYIRIEAAAFSMLHTKFGSEKTRDHTNTMMPTMQNGVVSTLPECTALVKDWRDDPGNLWLGDTARTDCNVVLEALEAIKSNDPDATRKMTADWPRQIAVRLAFYCRVTLDAKPAKGSSKEKAKPAEILAGRPAAEHLLKMCAEADARGDTCSASLKALMPYQFLLQPEELQRFLTYRSKNNLASGSAGGPSCSAPATKKLKLASEKVDPHAATWSLFRK